MISALALTLLVALGFSLGLTPLARWLAPRLGLEDRPDGRRKIQKQAMPVAGGLAIIAAMGAALILTWLLPESGFGQAPGEKWTFLGLFLGCTGICALGVVDDLGHLRGRHKLLGQVLIVLLVIACGVEVQRVRVLEWEFDLGLLSYPFTLILLLGAINSLNLLDGMDGLLSSVGIIICLTLAVMAGLTGRWTTAYVTVALAGALIGFLRYNFPPASIYLGDAGSMLIGLVVGVLAIQSSIKSQATVVMAVPTVLLAIPLFDTTAAIVRRKLTGRSIYSADRGHLHHCLLSHGWGTGWTLLIISSLCAMTAAGALTGMALNNEWMGVTCAFAVVALLIASRLFGYAELVLLGKRFISFGSSLIHLTAGESKSGYESGYDIQLQGTIHWKDLWISISSSCRELNLKTLSLDINAPALHENYHAEWNCPTQESDEVASSWVAEVPLTIQGRNFGRIQVVGRQDDKPVWDKIARLAQLGVELEKEAHMLADQAIPCDTGHALPGPHVNVLKAFHGSTVEPASSF